MPSRGWRLFVPLLVTSMRQRGRLPEGFVPGNGTQRAMLALVVHEVFLEPVPADSDTLAAAVLTAAGEGPATSQE